MSASSLSLARSDAADRAQRGRISLLAWTLRRPQYAAGFLLLGLLLVASALAPLLASADPMAVVPSMTGAVPKMAMPALPGSMPEVGLASATAVSMPLRRPLLLSPAFSGSWTRAITVLPASAKPTRAA